MHPHSSVYTLVLLSLDRYLAVVYPVRSIGLRTVCNATVAIVVVWTVVGAACVPILFVFFVKVERSAIGLVSYKSLIANPQGHALRLASVKDMSFGASAH